MTSKYDHFLEEELLESNKLSKPIPSSSEDGTINLDFVKQRKILFRNNKSNKKLSDDKKSSSPSINKVKELFPTTKFKSSNSNLKTGSEYKKLVVKVLAAADSPKKFSAQCKQLLYFSRIEQKEESVELRLKNKDTHLYDHNDNIIGDVEQIRKISKEWAEHKFRKPSEAISRHILFSIGDKEDKDQVLTATRQFLKETLLKKGYEYCYAPHYDTENDHVHLIVRKRNNLGKNFRLSDSDLIKFKKKYNEYLELVGIKRSLTRRLEDDEVIVRIRNQQEDLTKDYNWYQNRLDKGNDKDFNAYNYKSTLSNRIQEQINIIEIKDYLEQIGVQDKTLINVIKPILRKKGIKSIKEALNSVKDLSDKGKVGNVNGLILKSIKDDYKVKYKRKSGGLTLSKESKDAIKDLKQVKDDIINQENKKDILSTLNSSITYLKNKDKKLAKSIEDIFNDKNIRFSYVEKKKEIKNIDEIIEKKLYKPSEKATYYRPELTDYEIQEKFAQHIRESSNIEPKGLESAIARAFASPNKKERFGHKKQNEIVWYGEAGYIKNYKTQEFLSWGINSIKQEGDIKFKEISRDELDIRLKKVEEDKRQNEIKIKKKHEKVAQKSDLLFKELDISGQSKYLVNKQVEDIKLHNVKYKNSGELVIPMQDIEGKIWNFQNIDEDGGKRFEAGGKKQGNFFIISKEKDKTNIDNTQKPILIAEGLATGLTVHRASDYLDTIVVFDAGNIQSVVRNIKDKYPNKPLIIMADDDKKSEIKTGINAGLNNAYKTKEEFPDIKILKPSLTEEEKINKKLSDFNDLEKARGKEFLKVELDDQVRNVSISTKLLK